MFAISGYPTTLAWGAPPPGPASAPAPMLMLEMLCLLEMVAMLEQAGCGCQGRADYPPGFGTTAAGGRPPSRSPLEWGTNTRTGCRGDFPAVGAAEVLGRPGFSPARGNLGRVPDSCGASGWGAGGPGVPDSCGASGWGAGGPGVLCGPGGVPIPGPAGGGRPGTGVLCGPGGAPIPGSVVPPASGGCGPGGSAAWGASAGPGVLCGPGGAPVPGPASVACGPGGVGGGGTATTSAGGGPGGFGTCQRPAALSWSGQLQVVQDNFAVFDTAAEGGKADGKISREDLTAVACGAVPASPEARQTASLWLENPTLWQGLNPDGKLTRDDLTRARQKVVDNGSSLSGQPGGQQNWSQTLAALEGNFSLLDTAGKGGKGDGKVSRQDLQAVLDSGCASPEVRAAAQALLANPTLFDSLEGNGDGLFSQKDVKRARELAGGPGTAP